jgi:hypothetical protein
MRVVTLGTKRRSLENICKYWSMERSGVKCFHCTHVFDLTNLIGEKRRNVGKLNNELSILMDRLLDLSNNSIQYNSNNSAPSIRYRYSRVWTLLVIKTRQLLSEREPISDDYAVTWSKSNLNMMNIYEESTINFWIWDGRPFQLNPLVLLLVDSHAWNEINK